MCPARNHDVAIAGLGPAGRALASRCAAAGLSVLAVDPAPDAPWIRTLCLWEEQLPPWLGAGVLALTVPDPEIRAPHRRGLDLSYALVDNELLREALPLDGVTVRRRRVDARGLRALGDVADRVVDCRGAGPVTPRRPAQTAYGIVVDSADAAPALDGAEALLMDWRTDHGEDGPDDDIGPTFLYALPLPGGRHLLEETCLAGRPAPSPERLARRLRSRLLARGVPARAVEHPLDVEEVRIPLLPPRHLPGTGVERFGTSGGHGHPATGYSLGASLQAVAPAVWALESGRPLPAPRDHMATGLHRLGLRALLGADESTTLALFDAFGRLPERDRLWYLTGGTPYHRVAAAMWGMYERMTPQARTGLVRACVTG